MLGAAKVSLLPAKKKSRKIALACLFNESHISTFEERGHRKCYVIRRACTNKTVFAVVDWADSEHITSALLTWMSRKSLYQRYFISEIRVFLVNLTGLKSPLLLLMPSFVSAY